MAWSNPRTWTTGEVVTDSELNQEIRDNIRAVVPVGVILPFAGDTAPALFMICDGTAISRTTYADLFTLIGTTYGVGDGSTTFNLPDIGGRMIAGHVAVGGHTDVSTRGNNDGTALANRRPSHHHTYEKATNTINLGSSGGGNPLVSNTAANTSGGTPTDAPSYIVLAHIIKVSQ